MTTLLSKNKTTSDSFKEPDLLLEGTAELEELPEDYLSKACIGINFPVFSDGRGYSLARLIREAGYEGELRAVGDVLVDQLFYMKRCGFDAFLLRADQSTEDAIQALETFSEPYQMAADEQAPIHSKYLS